MRHLNTGLILGVAVLALGACNKSDETAAEKKPAAGAAATPAADAGPARKPGLWEQTISAEGMGKATTKICLGERVEPCPGATVTRTADGYTVNASCRIAGGEMKTEGTAKGDLQSAYELNSTVTMTGAAAAQMNKPMTFKTSLRWLEVCPEGMNVGDQQLPDGTVVNMANFDPSKAAAMAKDGGK